MLEENLSKLIDAVRNSNVDVVRQLLKTDTKLASSRIAGHDAGETRTLLHFVMPGDGREQTSAHLEIAKLLLDHGADVNALGNGPNLGQCRPLTIAAWGGHVELIQLLIDRGAELDGNPGCEQKGPLYAAAGHGHTAAVECLAQAGAKYELAEIVMAGLRDRVAADLDKNPNLVNRLTDGATLLHAALETTPGLQLVALLLERGADSSIHDALGRTPLQMAIEQTIWRDASKVISQLRENDSLSDIFTACGLGDFETVKQLIAENPDLANSTQTDGTSPLFYAVVSGRADIVELLLESGADPSPKSNRFWCCLTPLHLSLQQKQNHMTELLVSHGADVNAHGDCIVRWQPTPLHVASRWGDRKQIELLLDSGADMYAGGSGNVLGWTFSKEQMKLLIDRGLDLSHPACRLLLHKAAAGGRIELVKYLLELGLDPAMRNEQGQTVLQVAQAHYLKIEASNH